MRDKIPHQLLVQEILRVHPPIVELTRVPTQDDILPLTKPIVGTSGRVYSELPVPKGTAVTVSMLGYNLCVFVFFYSRHHLLSRALVFIYLFGAGTRMCRAQTLMNSDQSVGSK